MTCATTAHSIPAKLNLACGFQNLILCVQSSPSLEFRLFPKSEDFLLVNKADGPEVFIEEVAMIVLDSSLKVSDVHVLAVLSL
jgi:hypothetical protein